MTTIDTTKDASAKAAALALLSKGLITRAEAAKLAGISRQLSRHWAKGVKDRREVILAKLWAREMARKNR